MNYNKKKTIRNIILVVSLTLLVFIILFSFNDIEEVGSVLSTIDLKFFGIAILLALAYFVLYPVSLYILMRHRKCNVSFKDVFLVGSCEHFFNGITPFATGGQPFQAYALYKKGVKVHESTGILMMNYIIFMIVTNIFAIASLFYYNQYVTASGKDLLGLVIIGFGINFLVLLFIISLGISKHVRNGLIKLVHWFNKFKLFHKIIDKRLPLLENYMDEVQSACKELFHSPIAFFGCFLVKFAMMAIYYLLTFFVIKAIYPPLGYDQILYVLLGTSFAVTMVVWVPTPGGTGGIEFAFSTIFAGITLGQSIGLGGMVLWRLLTFYLMLILSFICYLLLNKSITNDEKKEQEKKILEEISSNTEIKE